MTETPTDTWKIPTLEVSKPGFGVRFASLFSSGVRKIRSQIGPYTLWWDKHNKEVPLGETKLLVVVGDSSAIGIGASDPANGYVELVRKGLENFDTKHQWSVINLARSGGKLADATDTFLPALEHLPPPDALIFCIGSNDIFWSSSVSDIAASLETIISQLPANSVVGLLAGGRKSSEYNKIIKQVASAEANIEWANPWRSYGEGKRRVAEDNFHPNDLGYQLMAEAFLEKLT